MYVDYIENRLLCLAKLVYKISIIESILNGIRDKLNISNIFLKVFKIH